MRRLLLSLLLATAGAAQAALPRVILETPVAPATAPSFSATPAASRASVPPNAAPLSMPSAALPSAAPSPAPAPAAALPVLAAPAAPSLPAAPHDSPLPPPGKKGSGPRALDALRDGAPQADAPPNNPDSSLEDAASAQERNFDAAGAPEPENNAAVHVHEPLLQRLLQRVRIDDGVPAQRAALALALERMLESPSVGTLAERFIGENVRASVRFAEFKDSPLYDASGNRIYYSARTATQWNEDTAEILVNRAYLDADEAAQRRDIPPALAQELFGNALWSARARRENLLPALQHHEHADANARLIGWLADAELNRRFEGQDAWGYLQDSTRYRSELKLRLPSYTLTFSNEELARPLEALTDRLSAAQRILAQLETSVLNLNSWIGVIRYFRNMMMIPERRLSPLGTELERSVAVHRSSIPIIGAVVDSIERLLVAMRAEPDEASARYLREAAAKPLLKDLEAESDAHARRLLEHVQTLGLSAAPEAPPSAPAGEDAAHGPIAFAELQRMHAAAIAHRPRHWNRLNAAPAPAANAPLPDRLLHRLWIDDEGVPERGEALRRAVSRMLASPSARVLAERFIAEDMSAVVRFESFENSHNQHTDGETIFHGVRAVTLWNDEEPVILLNVNYLTSSPRFRDQDLPPTLAHELLGHGLWYGRAHARNVLPAFHRHELNEVNAMLVGWIVDAELDHFLEDENPWSFLQDPADYLRRMKLRLSFYAHLYSNEELSRPIEALEDRLAALERKRAQLKEEEEGLLALDRDIERHAADNPKAALTALRAKLADDKSGLAQRTADVDTAIAEVRQSAARLRDDPERVDELALKKDGKDRFFQELRAEADANTRRLTKLLRGSRVRRAETSSESARRRDDHWKNQLTAVELRRLNLEKPGRKPRG